MGWRHVLYCALIIECLDRFLLTSGFSVCVCVSCFLSLVFLSFFAAVRAVTMSVAVLVPVAMTDPS